VGKVITSTASLGAEQGFWRIDFQLLRVFRSILHHRQLTAAANELGVTQSALSHSVRRLSSLLGEPLFIRTSKGMLPTPYANSIAERVEQVLASAESLFGVASSFAPSAQTLYRVGIVGETASIYAGNLASILQGNDAQLQIAPFTKDDIAAALNARKIDMAFLHGALESHGIERLMVMSTPFVVVARKQNPYFGSKKDMSLEKYLAARHISLSLADGDMVGHTLASSGLQRTIAVTASSALTALHMASESDFLATIPKALAQPYAKMQNLRLMPCPFAMPPYALYGHWLSGRQSDQHLQVLREAVQVVAQND